MQTIGENARHLTQAGEPDCSGASARLVLPRPLRKTVRRIRRLMDGGITITRRGVICLAGTVFAVTAFGLLLKSVPGDGVTGRIAPALGVAVEYYDLSGNHKVGDVELVKLIRSQHGHSTFFYDVDAARKDLIKHPWIADASVSKVYPDRLAIRVTEHRPFAFWQNDDGLWIVGREGGVLGKYDGRPIDLPLVVGKGASEGAARMIGEIRQFAIFDGKIKGLVRVGERRWDVEFKDGLVVMLPEKDSAAALRELVRLDKEQNLLARDIDRIDLRLEDRVVVRLGQNAAETVNARREEQIERIRSAGKERAI